MHGLPASFLALLLLAAATLSTPRPVLAKSADRNQPMDIDAGQSAWSMDDRQPSILSGGVTITQGTLDVRSDRAEVTSRGGEPVRVLLTGSPAKLKQQLDDGAWLNASANKIDYDLKGETVVLTGNVSLQQPRGNLRGERVVYNMRTGQVNAGEGGGRVKMRILPKNPPPTPAKGTH